MAQRPSPDVAFIAAYAAQTQALRLRLDGEVRRQWRALGSYRNHDGVTYAKSITPIVAAAQRQMLSLTTGYLVAQRNAVLGRSVTVRVNPKSVTGAAARNGAEPSLVYQRPFNLVWRQLHDLPRVPGAIEQAIESGEKRAVLTALTDLQLTKVQTTQQAARVDRTIVFSQRVLEGPSSCGLCIVASTQRYGPDELLPIHGGCDCAQRFVYSDEEPPPIIDIDTLADVHDRIHQRFAASSSGARDIPGVTDARGLALHYRDVLVVHEHGELGPVLGVRKGKFLGPDDL